MDYDTYRLQSLEADPYFMENYLAHSRRLVPGEKVPQSLVCVDERANKVISQENEGDDSSIIVSFPGGGIKFISEGEVKNLLLRSNGEITIYAHRLCGWGELTFNSYLYLDNNGAGSAYDTDDQYALYGVNTVLGYIGNALNDEYFRSRFVFDDQYILDEAEAYVWDRYNKVNNRNSDQNPYYDESFGEFFQWAFVYGQAIELKNEIYDTYNSLKERDYAFILRNGLSVTIELDPLEGQPHNHIANSAVINCTTRSIIDRFDVDGAPAFFADVDEDNIEGVVDLILRIMEGDHSDTQDTTHRAYVVCESEAQKAKIQKILAPYGGVNRKILFYVSPE